MGLIKGVYYEEIKKPDMKDRFKKEQPKSVEKKSSDGMITGMNFDAFKDITIPLDVQEVQPKQSQSRRRSNTSSTGVVPADNNTKYTATEP